MSRKLTALTQLIVFLIVGIKGFSQNASIDYSLPNSLNSSTSCNVFNQSGSNPTVGGSAHWPVSGGAIFDGTYIKMQTGSNTGTAYAFVYSFKVGFNYTIAVDMAYTATPISAFPKLTLSTRTSLPVPQDTDPTACGPVSGSKWQSSIGVTGAVIYPNPNTPANTTYTAPTFQVSAARGYLVLTVSDGNSNGATVSVKKVVITETAIASFNVSSSVSSMNCGSTDPITFTMNNLGGTTGITGYTWYVGSGWLYGGNPAPAVINTIGNTLQLSPDCGRLITGVSATATANGNTFPSTNQANISVVRPTYTIVGNTSLCSGSTTYTLNAPLGCNSTVTWDAPPANLATLSSLNSPTTTLTHAGGSGNFVLTANISSCGGTLPTTLPVRVGAYTNADFSIVNSTNGSMYWCPNQSLSFYVSGLNGASGTNYLWQEPSGWQMLYNGGGSYYCVAKAPTSSYPPTGSMTATFTEPCGTTLTETYFMSYSSSACVNNCFTYSPNPASSYLSVNVASGCIGSTYIRKIELVRAATGVSVYYQDYTYGNVTSTTITMSSYPSGNYILRIYDGSSWSTYNIAH